jgi:AcrR family transcriptional regulator
MTEEARPLRADARRNRASVIAAAELVLARYGISASMRDIARQANVGLATVYRQFPTKEALYEAITRDRVQRLLVRAQSSTGSPEPGTAFFDFFAYAVETSTGERALADSLADAGLDPKAGTAPMYRELEDVMEVLLRRAQDAGEIRPDVDMPEVLALITSSCYAADRQQWSPELRAHTLRIIFDGLGLQRAGGGRA